MKKLPFRRFLSCLALCALLTGMLPASASAVPPKASGTQFRDVSASHPAAAQSSWKNRRSSRFPSSPAAGGQVTA